MNKIKYLKTTEDSKRQYSNNGKRKNCKFHNDCRRKQRNSCVHHQHFLKATPFMKLKRETAHWLINHL